MNDLAIQYSFDLSPLDRKYRAGDLAEGTYNHYRKAVSYMMDAGIDPFDRTDLETYANALPHSGKANLKAALSIMLDSYVDEAKTSNKPVEMIQRFLWSVDVIKKTLKVKAAKR